MPFLDLAGIGGRMAHTWGTLLDYVRTGQPAYQQVFGRPFWEDLAAHPAIGAEFDALMGPAGHGVPDFDVELSDGWDTVRTVVDVGGGTGAMLASLLRRHPRARGILVDLPGTVARAGEIIESLGVAERVTAEAQSFFDPLPAGADLYLLKSVLNDWPDEPTVAILRRCAEAATTLASQPSPSSAASRPTKRRARWASTCWWRAARPARSPSSPSSPAGPAWTSSPPAPSHPAVSWSSAAQRLRRDEPCPGSRNPRPRPHPRPGLLSAAPGGRQEPRGRVLPGGVRLADRRRTTRTSKSPGLIGQWVEGRHAGPGRRAGALARRRRHERDARTGHYATAVRSSSLPPPTARPAPWPRIADPEGNPIALGPATPTRRVSQGFSFRRNTRRKDPPHPLLQCNPVIIA